MYQGLLSKSRCSNLKKSKSMSAKKGFIWLVSTIAAVVVGIFIERMVSSRPDIEVHVSTHPSYETASTKSWPSYNIYIENTGSVTLRDLSGRIDLYSHWAGEDQEFKSINIEHFTRVLDCTHTARYRKLEHTIYPSIEFGCKLLEPGQSFKVRFTHRCQRCDFDMKVLAVGMRYRGAFRSLHKQDFDRHETLEVE